MRYDCWNMGYTTEATLAMMNYVRENHNAHRFTAECAVENIGSARVMEKCGLHFTGNGEYQSYDGKKTFISKIYELEDKVNDKAHSNVQTQSHRGNERIRQRT